MGDGVRLTILHQNRLFRECLSSVLAETANLYAVHGDVPSVHDLTHFASHRPDVVLLEMRLPVETTAQSIEALRRAVPGVKVVVLVPAKVDEAMVGCIQVGANGCVLDEASLDELRTVIQTVACGESYCSPQIANSMFAQLGKLARESRWSQRIDSARLTSRELEILRLIADEQMSNKQIAIQLKLSLYTVKNHVHNILEKLQVETRAQAAEYAYEQHLL
jgi:two-component system NarL family response regulator